MNKFENIFEKFIIGGVILLVSGMLIIIPYTIGSELIKQFGIWGLLLVPIGFIIVIAIGWAFKLIFPKSTVYEKED